MKPYRGGLCPHGIYMDTRCFNCAPERAMTVDEAWEAFAKDVHETTQHGLSRGSIDGLFAAHRGRIEDAEATPRVTHHAIGSSESCDFCRLYRETTAASPPTDT